MGDGFRKVTNIVKGSSKKIKFTKQHYKLKIKERLDEMTWVLSILIKFLSSNSALSMQQH